MTSTNIYYLQLAVSLVMAAGPILCVLLPHLLLIGRDPFRTMKPDPIMTGDGFEVAGLRSGRGRAYKVSAPGVFSPLEIGRAGWSQALCARLGVVSLATAKTDGRTLRLYSSPRLRGRERISLDGHADLLALAAALLTLPGASRITAGPDGLAVLFTLPSRLQLKDETLHQAGELIRKMAAALPTAPAQTPASATFTSLAVRSLIVTFLLCLAGAGMLTYGLDHFQSLDYSIYPDIFRICIPAGLGVAILAMIRLRRRAATLTGGHSLFLTWLPALFMSFFLVLTGGYVYTNSYMDREEMTISNVPVVGHWSANGKNIIAFPIPGQPGHMRSLTVDSSFFATVKEGDRLSLITRPGAFGHPWIQSYAKGN